MFTLYTIPASHYCEKARWVLEYLKIPFIESKWVPVFHYLNTLQLGVGRTVPILKIPQPMDPAQEIVDGSSDRPTSNIGNNSMIIPDSCAITEFLAKHGKSQALYGVSSADELGKCKARELEVFFGTKLGPATRRVAYYILLLDPVLTANVLTSEVGSIQQYLYKLFSFMIVLFLKKGLSINEASYLRSLARVKEIFQQVDQMLLVDDDEPSSTATISVSVKDPDGAVSKRKAKEFLVGNRLTMADITFCSMVSIILLPPELTILSKHHMFESLQPEFQKVSQDLRDTVSGQYVMNIYRKYRNISVA